MNFVGSSAIILLREDPPTRRDRASDLHPLSSIEKHFVLPPESWAGNP
jgi:hypothetical protein